MEQIPFPNKKYQIIYADPPWSYCDKALAGKGAPEPSSFLPSLLVILADLEEFKYKNPKWSGCHV